MGLILSISPHGRLIAATTPANESLLDEAIAGRIAHAFSQGQASGLLHMASRELETSVPPGFAFARDFACNYFTRLCHTPDISSALELTPIPAPDAEGLAEMAAVAPPMRGLEYLTPDCLAGWWTELDNLVRQQMTESRGSVQDYLRELNPAWRTVGRVTFHLAENKHDLDYPFAFLATYATRLSAQGKAQHLPLGRALEEYAGAKNRSALLALLQPIQRAGERSVWVQELTDSGEIYHPLAWTPADAYRFLKSIPALEESGLIVRVPDWWKAARPPRPVVNVKIGERAKGKLGADALLDFSVGVALDGEPLDEKEIRDLLRSSGALVLLRGQWVEVDRDKLAEALKHWKQVERGADGGGLSFFEGMRLLAGIGSVAGTETAEAEAKSAQEWVGIAAGSDLEQLLGQLRKPEAGPDVVPTNLRGELRPYQRIGVHWLRFVTRLGLGACLADDMGLGKTIQVIALLLHLQSEAKGGIKSNLLVVPASLIANWKSELSRFGPSLHVFIAHPSENSEKNGAKHDSVPDAGCDLVITTYSMLARLEWLRQRDWRLVILDEAQAIRNSGTRQSRAVRELCAAGRIALTGTPVENRLSDLWSLFDFLNPGLLGGAKAFSRFAKQLAAGENSTNGPNPYGPLRTLVGPYILRRLKTDKRVIADLPEKTEINAFCGLSRRQAALYEQSVRELASVLDEADGIKRRGVVLAYLMRLKQICNHPSQWTGDNGFDPEESGKFQRLAEICRELAERQEKVLVFTQFREITAPLADFLANVFGCGGLVLHGQTAVAKRRELVEAFQRDDGPPFFVLSLKAGGTGLNLTEASHVIHFDRWWNPAVENQATDRAFRIGQKRNVLVHKFVCRGTVEDKIDELIAQKVGLARDLVDGGGEALLTEMSDDQLLRFVALDVAQAMEK
ncbi:MAG: DEAD/DEAH box helicase [Terracidiphilus sp.]|jgi:non-specific serine/threonine protein kinase